LGRQPSVIASNGDASPCCESRRLCYAPVGCLPWHLGTGIVSAWIGSCTVNLYTCTARWTHDRAEPRAGIGVARWRNGCARGAGGSVATHRDWSVGRLRRRARGVLTVRRDPVCLRVDAWHARASAGAPRALQRARCAAEVRDHATASAAGHTLPRLMRHRCLTLAVAAVACHEAITLAFHA